MPALPDPHTLLTEKSQRGRVRGHWQTSQTESSHTCAHVARPARLDAGEEKEGKLGLLVQTLGLQGTHLSSLCPPSGYRLEPTLCAGRPVPGGAGSGPGFSPPRRSLSSHRQGASTWGEGEGRARPEQGCLGRPREKAVYLWAGPGPRGLGASSHLPPEGELGPSRPLMPGLWSATLPGLDAGPPVWFRFSHLYGHSWSLGRDSVWSMRHGIIRVPLSHPRRPWREGGGSCGV